MNSYSINLSLNKQKLNKTLWLNGRASDSGSEGSGFESQQGCIIIFVEKENYK